MDAVNQLRDAFNLDSCRSIWEQAAAEFRDQTMEAWTSECEELRESFGAWQVFKTSSVERYTSSPDDFRVYGPAVFVKGGKQVGVDWRLRTGRAWLVRLSFQETEFLWRSLPPVRNYYRLRDSPLKPESPSGGMLEHFPSIEEGRLAIGRRLATRPTLGWTLG